MSRERRPHLRIVEGDIGLPDERLLSVHGGARRVSRRHGVVVDLPRDGFVGQQGRVARDIRLRRSQLRARGFQLRERRRPFFLGFERLDGEQQLAFLDHLTICDVLFEEDSARTGPQFDFLRRNQFTDELAEAFDVPQFDRGDLHGNLGHLGGRRFAAGREHREHEKTPDAQGEVPVR